MVTRQELHELVDRLREDDLKPAVAYLSELDARHDALLARLLAAPYDDEPETDEERQAVQQGRDAVARGDVVTDEELRRELGL